VKNDRRAGVVIRRQLNPQSVRGAMDPQHLRDPPSIASSYVALIEGGKPLIG
jgi:hypothetical protein